MSIINGIKDKNNIVHHVFPQSGKKDQVLVYDSPGSIGWRTISNIFIRDKLVNSQIPDYVRNAAVQLADKVRAVQTEDTITFISISDSHHLADQVHSWATLTNAGNLHAAQAIKILTHSLKVDFGCHLGDYTFGHTSTSTLDLAAQINEMNEWLDEAFGGVPNIRSVGNHDTGEYGSELIGASTEFELIGAHCSSDAVFGSTDFGYCYVDLPDKKIRMINLNSCEGETLYGENAQWCCSDEQRLWFANVLADVGQNEDWGFCVFCHYPLDYGYTYAMGDILYAYLNAESITINGTTINYYGQNMATFVAQFHGHVHNYKVDNIHKINNGSGTSMGVSRIATPNSAFYRNNQYNDNGVPDSWGIEFGQSETYDKTANTASDTAFSVNVIDPQSNTIYSFAYGAGYDRAVAYNNATPYYRFIYDTYKATVNTTVPYLRGGSSYSTTLTPASGHTLDTVTVTMGGTDITSTAYSNGTINIANVTGDVTIVARGFKQGTYTNQVSTSTDENGNVFNTVGYKDRARLNSSGEQEDNFSHHAVTGFIPFSSGDTLRIGGDNVLWDDYGCMIGFYKADKSPCKYMLGYQFAGNTSYGTWDTEENAAVVHTPSAAKLNQIEFPETGSGYIRVSAKTENGEDLIVTINQVIDGQL